VPDGQPAASLGECSRLIATAIVGHDAGDLDAKAAIMTDRGFEERDGAGLLLVGKHLTECEAGMIVDRNMSELPSRPDSTRA
jgi:hypothetical protein